MRENEISLYKRSGGTAHLKGNIGYDLIYILLGPLSG